MAPWDPTHYPAGAVSPTGVDLGGQISAASNFKNIYNPFTQIETNHPDNKDERLIGNINLVLKPLKWLTFKSSLSLNRYHTVNRSFRESYFFSGYDNNPYNSVSGSMSRSTELFLENTLTFAKKIKKHDFSVMLGQTTESFDYYSVSASGQTIMRPDDSNKWYVSQTTENRSGGDGVGRTRRLSFLGRLFYNYDDRYLVTVNFRADGSSKFPENTWGFFPSLAGAWRISEEPFMENATNVYNLKLRLSWGRIGNDKIGDGAFDQTISSPGPIFSAYPFGPTNTNKEWQVGDFDPSATILTYVNTGGRWEYTEQWDAGVDFGFWDNKLYGTVDAYIRDTRDMLLSVQAPAIVGNRYQPTANVGTVRNKGIEIMVGHMGGAGKDFRYDINANVSFVHNRLTHLNGGERVEATPRMCDEGLPLYALYGWEYEGIYRSDEEALQHQWGVKSDAILEHEGDARYRDQNNDGIINDLDRVNIGNPFPWLTYGANINLSWKGIDLTVFLQGVYGNKISNALRSRLEGDGTGGTLSTAMRDVWSATNRDGSIPNPAPGSSSRNREVSSRFVEDGSYLRLKNLQLGYTLPQNITRKFHVSSWRFYISCNNLLTATKYSGYDPEVGGGVDWGNYPQARTVLFGTTIKF